VSNARALAAFAGWLASIPRVVDAEVEQPRTDDVSCWLNYYRRLRWPVDLVAGQVMLHPRAGAALLAIDTNLATRILDLLVARRLFAPAFATADGVDTVFIARDTGIPYPCPRALRLLWEPIAVPSSVSAVWTARPCEIGSACTDVDVVHVLWKLATGQRR
jgi:hypothetical protein